MEKNKNIKNIMIIILSVLVILLAGILIYVVLFNKAASEKADELLITEKESNSVDVTIDEDNRSNLAIEKECDNNSICLGEQITSLKKIELTRTNQNIIIGNKTYQVRIDDYNAIYVNDYINNGGNNYANHLYLTDKFAFFTTDSQVNEYISYAISEIGEVEVNNNNCLSKDYRIVDGYLHATGGTEIGFETWDNKDLLIKYVDNTLIVTYAQ